MTAVAEPPSRTAIALTIAGSDSSGGAGIQADLKTFTALGVYGASVITALTAQNTRGVQGIHPVPPAFVAQQLNLGAVGIGRRRHQEQGMLANADIIGTVAAMLGAAPARALVVDPVMVATSSAAEPDAVGAMKELLLPLATLVTPNLAEAALLLRAPNRPRTRLTPSPRRRPCGWPAARAVLIKGGHGRGGSRRSTSWLTTRGWSG